MNNKPSKFVERKNALTSNIGFKKKEEITK